MQLTNKGADTVTTTVSLAAARLPEDLQQHISVNEYQLLLERQRQVWFIPLADERGVCR